MLATRWYAEASERCFCFQRSLLRFLGSAELHAYAHLDRLPLTPAFVSLVSGWQFVIDLPLSIFAGLVSILLSVPAYFSFRAARRTFLGLLLALTLFNVLNAVGVTRAVAVLWVHADVPTTIRCQVVSFIALGFLWLAFFPVSRSGTLAARLALAVAVTLFIVFLAAPGAVGYGF